MAAEEVFRKAIVMLRRCGGFGCAGGSNGSGRFVRGWMECGCWKARGSFKLLVGGGQEGERKGGGREGGQKNGNQGVEVGRME